jgi:vacuolar protein sorting-associated protein 35
MDFIRQAANAAAIENQSPQLADAEIKLDHPSIVELQKMLTIPLESLALKVLELSHYSELLQLLPWGSRRDVGMTMLRSMDTSGIAPTNVSEVKQLFRILIPVIRDQQPADGIEAVESVARRNKDKLEGNNLVSRLVHLLDHDNVDFAYEMLLVARSHLQEANDTSMELALVPVVFSSLRLMNRIAFRGEETEVPRSEGTTVEGNNAAGEGTLNAVSNGDGNKSFTSSSSEEPVEGSGEGTVMSPNESEVKTRGDNPVESKGSPSALTYV